MDTGNAKVYENMAYGVTTIPVAPEKHHDEYKDREEKSCPWWCFFCSNFFGF